MVFEILFYIVLAIVVAVSIAFIVVNGKNKVKYDKLVKETERKENNWNTERSERQAFARKQEESYKILSESNTDLMREIEDAKVLRDETKEQNRLLNQEIIKLRNDVTDLEVKLKTAIAVNEALKKQESAKKEKNLEELTREELLKIAKENGISGLSKATKAVLIEALKVRGICIYE